MRPRCRMSDRNKRDPRMSPGFPLPSFLSRCITPARRRKAVLFLAIALSSVSGCLRTSNGERAGDTITLHVADWGGADPAMARFEDAVATEWKRTHPNIAIAQEHIPGSDEYVPKMLTAFVAGTEPDIMTLDTSSAAVFIQ